MSEASSETERLATRFADKAAAGMLDVRFHLDGSRGATVEEVSAEVNRLYEAVELGYAEPLDFGDAGLS